MTFGTLHAWHVAMRGLLLSPSPVVAVLLLLFVVVICGTDVYWVLRPPGAL